MRPLSWMTPAVYILAVFANVNAFAADPDSSAAALRAFADYLTTADDQRADWHDLDFAKTPLTAADAEHAKEMAWLDYRRVQDALPDTQTIEWNGFAMPYMVRIFGQKPATGRSLFISLHGGGGVPKPVNDQQWNNQIGLYQPAEGVYVAPRAPTDAWDMWHQSQVDEMLTQLITRMILKHDVNPNRVYLMGYSAGGDGVYQLAPRMADRWAAATAAAGHPNGASALNLRNIGFSIYVGEYDSAYNRNAMAVEWRDKLDVLAQADANFYQHVVEVVPGAGHWMYLKDAVAVPWMATYTRNLVPAKVVWFQDDVVSKRFYWLSLTRDEPRAGELITATYEGQNFTLDAPEGRQVSILLRDDMVELDERVHVQSRDGTELYDGNIPRTIGNLLVSLEERGDPSAMFSGRINLPALE